jgi:hypothetical protein
MTILDFSFRAPARLAACALAGALLTTVSAQARHHDLGIGGPASGGYVNGLPVRARAAATGPSTVEPSAINPQRSAR